MSISFTPQISEKTDKINTALTRAIFGSIVVVVFLVPLFWLHPGFLLLGASKILLTALMVVIAVIATSLLVLRRGKVSISIYAALIAWWGIVLSATISAIMSNNTQNALFGSLAEVSTVAFLALLGFVMMIMTTLRDNKKYTLLVISGFVMTVFIITLHHLVRVIFGASALSFGFLSSPTDTLLLGWNNLAIYLTIGVGVMLISMVQLQLQRMFEVVMLVFLVPMLILLATINFFMLWVFLALFSLALLLYSLSRDYGTGQARSISVFTLIAISITAITSIFCLLGGNMIGNYLAGVTDTSFVEVRPSLGMTLDIMRETYRENPILGVGPNQFLQAWQHHKDVGINQSIFWDVNFSSGFGYIPTWFVTTGILGLIAWVVFLMLFAYQGIRTLMKDSDDVFWYYTATVSFWIAGVVLLTSFVYVPSITVLLLGAVGIGLFFASSKTLSITPLVNLEMVANRRSSFALIAGVLVVIISSVSVGFFTVQRFSAQYVYASIVANAGEELDIDDVLSTIARAYELQSQEQYLQEIITIQLAQLNSLLQIEEPSESEQQRFNTTLSNAIQVATLLTNNHPHSSASWLTLGDVYAFLSAIEVEGASTRANEAYERAKTIDPKNPTYDLRLAQVALRDEDVDLARAAISRSLALKANYVEAIALLSQIDVLTGNIDDAISATRSLITIQPNNEALYYQLGMLFVAQEEWETAIRSFADALTLNQNFANARYMRALLFGQLGDRERAISELEIVRELSDDNAIVNDVISQLRDTSVEFSVTAPFGVVPEPSAFDQQNDAVISSQSDSDLISTVNTPSNRNQIANDETSSESDRLDTPREESNTTDISSIE